VHTERHGHAAELAAMPGADLVIAFGGDGTANEVVNGIPPGVLLGVLPAGASSVFARQLGLTRDPLRAASKLADALAAGSIRKVGLGVVNGRRFTFSAGLGLDAEATRRVDAARAAERGGGRPGDLRVIVAAVGALRGAGFALHERMTLNVPGRPPLRCSYVAIANQHPYTYLGRIPVQAAPKAGFDSALDVVAARELRSRDLWRLVVYSLIWPRHARGGNSRIAYLHDVARFDIECDVPMPLQLDGEYIGAVARAEVTYQPEAIDVVAPPP
ncbi:MAG: diacylglycerol/lipid kinase family protein, partial [Gaiellales bacterium]